MHPFLLAGIQPGKNGEEKMKKYIKKIIWKIRGINYADGVIWNYRKLLNKKIPQKTALLFYFTKPILSSVRRVPHNNWGIVRNIVKALNQLGFAVDIADWDNPDFVPRKRYDLFIGHGGRNYGRIAEKLNSGCVKIFFTAGAHWQFNNEREIKRIDEVNRKKNTHFQPHRCIDSEEEGLKSADGVIALGDDCSKKTYAEYPNVHTLENFFYPDKKFNLKKKDFAAAKNNFLFLSGSGNIHKGLDLTLEAFSKSPGRHLYICAKLEAEFSRIYHQELFATENIHYIGFVKESSPEIRKIMAKCAYFIHPSCSEGSPGAVILAMSYGLIPIISWESNVNVDSLGYRLPENTAEEIIKAVKLVSGREFDYREAERIRQYSESNFSEKAFLRKIRSFIETIIKNRTKI